MRAELAEEQIRYVMSKIEADVVAGVPIADQVERELDLVLMDEEQRETEQRRRAMEAYEADQRAAAERWSAQFRGRY